MALVLYRTVQDALPCDQTARMYNNRCWAFHWVTTCRLRDKDMLYKDMPLKNTTTSRRLPKCRTTRKERGVWKCKYGKSKYKQCRHLHPSTFVHWTSNVVKCNCGSCCTFRRLCLSVKNSAQWFSGFFCSTLATIYCYSILDFSVLAFSILA